MRQPELDPALLKNRVMAGAGEPLLSVREACAVLDCNERQLDLLLENGVLHRAPISGAWLLVPASEIRQYLQRKAGYAA